MEAEEAKIEVRALRNMAGDGRRSCSDKRGVGPLLLGVGCNGVRIIFGTVSFL